MGQGGLKMKEGALPLILLLEVNTEVVMRISGIAGPAVCHGHVVMDVLIDDFFRVQPTVDSEGGFEIPQRFIGFGQIDQCAFVPFIQGEGFLQQFDRLGRPARFEAGDPGVEQNVLVGGGELQRPPEVFE